MNNAVKKITGSIVFLLVFCFAMISLYPLIWVLIQSFKTESEFLQSIWTLPGKIQFAPLQLKFC